MDSYNEQYQTLAAKISVLEEQLRLVLGQVAGNGDTPDDSTEAHYFRVPMYRHIHDLRQMLHARAQAEQMLVGLLEELERGLEVACQKLDRNADLSTGNADALLKVNEIMRDIGRVATRIEENTRSIARENPLLMRDIFYIDTNATELILIAVTACESIVFFSANDSLLRSAMFSAMSNITAVPIAWGLGCGALTFGSLLAFFTRSRALRIASAASNSLYFGVTGGLTMALQPGVLGWIMHVVLFGAALWVFVRGPSRAV